MPLTMGVEMVERSNRTKAMKNRRVKGVAGRSIVKVGSELGGEQVEMRERMLFQCRGGE